MSEPSTPSEPRSPVLRRPPGCSTEPRELREALREVLRAHAVFAEHRRPCGTPLSVPHAWVLLDLLAFGPMTITELATRLSIDRSNVSRLCTRLERDGEVARAPHPEDGRAVQIALTDRGRHLASDVDSASAAHFQRVLARLDGPSEPLIDALRLLAGALAPVGEVMASEPAALAPEPAALAPELAALASEPAALSPIADAPASEPTAAPSNLGDRT